MAAEIIAFIVQWVVVPLIMLAFLIVSWLIRGGKAASSNRASANAGFWAGLVIFVIYVTSQLDILRDPDFDFTALPGFLFEPSFSGLAAGFASLWVVKMMAPTRLVGVITLILSATSTSALFTYIFIESLRPAILYASLGTTLGVFLSIVFFPDNVKEIFGDL